MSRGAYKEGGSGQEVDEWRPTLGGRQTPHQTSGTQPSKDIARKDKKSRPVLAGT